MENTYKVKTIKTTEIPESKARGKSSKVAELLNQIPRGQTGVFDCSAPIKPATIRSYIEKAHKKGQLHNFTTSQRSLNKIVTLYVTHESPKATSAK